MSRLLFFFVFLYTVTTVTSTTSGATSCRTSCGNIQINYPFGIDKGCGASQFQGMLNCTSTDLDFFTPSGAYRVRSIDYDENTMVVFDPLIYDTVRVMNMNILDCSHYTTVIDDGKMRGVTPVDWSYGIELSYSVPEIGCDRCQKSGGTCGFDAETNIFLCQCPVSNDVSPRDCGGGVSDKGGCNSSKANYATLLLAMLVSFICAIL
ncbi:hypothetical protein BRARA_E02449 [Brassica rapa]|uniref:non-specific serine/threonine protein kinase n=1 Tax=Brassica campestris TaxID=3711 RepID=A0A397ZJC5_BRACM|nr:hypothetical protein BRARA_E02449 [Brassica rapa]